MTFDDYKGKVGRRPCFLVELVYDKCTNSYGNSPCTAQIGTTGPEKCYNGYAHCQDRQNFNKGTDSLWFCSDVEDCPENVLPWVSGVSVTPSKVSVSGDPLAHATVSITLYDHPFSDVLVDPYFRERTRSAVSSSTFLRKFLVRHPYQKFRDINVYFGFLNDGFDLSKFKKTSWIIDSVSRPDTDGRVTIKAKDILKRLYRKNAQYPLPSSGRLTEDINDSETTFTVDDDVDVDAEYGTSGYLRIGDETMTYTRPAASRTFTVARAQRGSKASSHEVNSTVQESKLETGRSIDILYKYLTQAGLIPAGQIDFTQWETEYDTWTPFNEFEVFLSEPTGIEDLTNEWSLISQTAVYWDPVDAKVFIRSAQPSISTNSTTITQAENILLNSVNSQDNTDKQVTQVWISYGVIDPGGDLDSLTNYRETLVLFDSSAEGANEWNASSVKHFFCRYLDNNNQSAAFSCGGRLLLQRRNPPEEISFELDLANFDVRYGSLVKISSREFIDEHGEPRLFNAFITSDRNTGERLVYEAVSTGYDGRQGVIMEDTATSDFVSATDEEKEEGAYICDDLGFMPDNSEGYRIS